MRATYSMAILMALAHSYLKASQYNKGIFKLADFKVRDFSVTLAKSMKAIFRQEL